MRVTTIAKTFHSVVSLQVGCTFMGEGVFFPPHNWIHVLKHPHVHPVQKHTNTWLVWGPNAAVKTRRNRKICPHTPICTTGTRLPQRPVSHVQQIHTSTVMSVCTSHPGTADPFIRDPAAQGRPQHASASPPSECLMVSEQFLSHSQDAPYVIMCTLSTN